MSPGHTILPMPSDDSSDFVGVDGTGELPKSPVEHAVAGADTGGSMLGDDLSDGRAGSPLETCDAER